MRLFRNARNCRCLWSPTETAGYLPDGGQEAKRNGRDS